MRNDDIPMSPVTPGTNVSAIPRFHIVGSKRRSKEPSSSRPATRKKPRVLVQASTATFAIGSVENPRILHNSRRRAIAIPITAGTRVASVADIRIAGNPSRTQYSNVGGTLEVRLLEALDVYENNFGFDIASRSTFIQSFINIPPHSTTVSFLARCCCRVTVSLSQMLLVLVDANNHFAFLQIDATDATMRDTPVLWKDVQVHHRALPKSLLSFLLNQAARQLNIQVGDADELRNLPVFKK